MRIIKKVSEMHAAADDLRAKGCRIGLVPTMGALHDGHRSLVEEAKRRSDVVIVSIFVNPTQFGPGEDFEKYPRPFQADVARLRDLDAVALVFAPEPGELYPSGDRTKIVVGGLTEHLCGRYRPGHFSGVATVVAKLFNACKPHIAVFGLKDAQQFIVLKSMVRDLDMDVEMVGIPTVREADGLAMSSRNAYLSPAERAQAPVIHRALQEAERLIRSGDRNVGQIESVLTDTMSSAPLARVQYAQIVQESDLQPVESIEPGGAYLVAAAVFFGGTRLIDNVFVRAPA